MFIQDVRLKGDNENRQKAQFVYNMQLTCTTTFTKQLTRCCLEMSEIEIMLFRKWLTAWLQITRTLKKMLAEATYNFSCCNIHSKRHNKNHLPASWQFPSASVNLQLKSSRRKLAPKVVKTELN